MHIIFQKNHQWNIFFVYTFSRIFLVFCFYYTFKRFFTFGVLGFLLREGILKTNKQRNNYLKKNIIVQIIVVLFVCF